MKINTIMAPAKAASKIIAPPSPSERGDVVDNKNMLSKIDFPETSVTNATPNDAPELMPKIDDSAKGLRNNVCMDKPAVESAMPAVAAAIAAGRRNFKTMV